MIESINREILKLKEKLREYDKIASLKDSKLEELSKKKFQGDQLMIVLDKERKDVEKLESLSMFSMLSTILGNKYEKLDKEKQEYIEAKLKYEEWMDNIDRLEEEIEQLKISLIDYRDIKSEYKDLISEKEELIIREGGSAGIKLKNLTMNIDESKIDIKEVSEAIDAGEKTLESLGEVRKKLKSAKGWGTWDILGGGFISDIAKHSAINEANEISVDVQHNLEAFKKELSDVNEFTDIQVNLSSFAQFADFFFDGIFADWFVQTKINNSLNNVNGTIEKIQEIISDLDNNLVDLKQSLRKDETNLKDILER